MIGFNLFTTSGGIFLYYTKDTIQLQHNFVFDPQWSARFTQFEHDTQASIIESSVSGGTSFGDSLLFVQGMQGVHTKVEIPHIGDLKGLIVNHASMEFVMASLDEDDPLRFDPVEQIIVSSLDDEGELRIIEDITNSGSSLSDVFGGVPEEMEGGGPMVYRFNLSGHLQKMIDGELDNSIFLTAFRRSERAHRVVLYGANHSVYPIKLEVTYTGQ